MSMQLPYLFCEKLEHPPWNKNISTRAPFKQFLHKCVSKILLGKCEKHGVHLTVNNINSDIAYHE